jgi:hypothetical protein
MRSMIRFSQVRLALVGTLLALAVVASAGAAITPYTGLDVGAGPVDARPLSTAAAASFDTAASALGPVVTENFESTSLGYSTSLSLSSMTVTLTGMDPGNAGISNSSGDAILGYNTTSGGAKFLQFWTPLNIGTSTVEFTFVRPVQAWGAMFTGVGTVADTAVTVEFSDGTTQSYDVPHSSAGGAGFFGFTDPGKQIASVTVQEDRTGSTRDIFGIDDVQFVSSMPSNLSLSFSASGTPDISATTSLGFVPAAVYNGDPTTFTMFVTQPVNICRPTNTCPAGYPNWGAHVTITGLQAAGLGFTGNGDTSAGCTQVTLDKVTCNYPFFNNNLKSDHFDFTETGNADGNFTINVDVQVYDKTPTDALPTNKDQCKNNGWATFNTLSFTSITGGYFPVFTSVFKNQGDCVSFVATGGTNLPAGS